MIIIKDVYYYIRFLEDFIGKRSTPNTPMDRTTDVY